MILPEPVAPPRPAAAAVSAALSAFDSEIRSILSRYTHTAARGNLWEDDIRQEARVTLAQLVLDGVIAPDPITGEFSESDRGIAYVRMRRAVHTRLTPMRTSLTISSCTLDKYRRARALFFERRPGVKLAQTTASEVAETLGVPPDLARNLLTVWRGEVSLEAPVGHADDSTATVGDFLADDDHPHPGTGIETRELAQRVRGLLANLTEHQREALVRRFGLHTGREESCAAIAASRGSSRQSVDEQCRLALRHLRDALETYDPALAA